MTVRINTNMYERTIRVNGKEVVERGSAKVASTWEFDEWDYSDYAAADRYDYDYITEEEGD